MEYREASKIGETAAKDGNLDTKFLLQNRFFPCENNHQMIKELGDYGRANFKNDFFILEFGVSNIGKKEPDYIWSFKRVHYCH